MTSYSYPVFIKVEYLKQVMFYIPPKQSTGVVSPMLSLEIHHDVQAEKIIHLIDNLPTLLNIKSEKQRKTFHGTQISLQETENFEKLEDQE